MMLMLALAFATQAAPYDCGTAKYARELRDTDALIVQRAALKDDLVGEMPTKSGRPACVRFVFSIDTDGHAKNITEEDSSRDYRMSVAARRALEAYRFKPAAPGGRHMLVFHAIVNKAPPFPGAGH